MKQIQYANTKSCYREHPYFHNKLFMWFKMSLNMGTRQEKIQKTPMKINISN